MSTATYLVGDVFDRVAELRRRGTRASLVLCSPPFLALRSYLPVGHPLKGREIGSEATPAAFVDVMLALVAELAHVLAPWGSVALELGDTYAGSDAGGWPRDKSLAGIPQAVMLSLAYGYNVLDRRGPDSPAGRWMVRNYKPWIRSNPPVGALGDKERPATSYVIVATRDPARFFDLDAVRTAPSPTGHARGPQWNGGQRVAPEQATGSRGDDGQHRYHEQHAAGAPPRDWCHSVDMVLDAEIDRMAGKTNGGDVRPGSNVTVVGKLGHDGGDASNNNGHGRYHQGAQTTGARGVHLRRALERAGIIATLDALDVSPKGYRGAHYAVWPPELVRVLVAEMCPARVCATCGQPSRRIAQTTNALGVATGRRTWREHGTNGVGAGHTGDITTKVSSAPRAERRTLGWSDCGHDAWRPGLVLDPFAGSGTTLSVASGMGRASIGVDIDYTNAALAMDRVGLWLDVEWPDPDLELLEHRALGPGSPHPADYDRWARSTGDVWHVWGGGDEPAARTVKMTADRAVPAAKAPRRAPVVMAGQGGLFG